MSIVKNGYADIVKEDGNVLADKLTVVTKYTVVIVSRNIILCVVVRCMAILALTTQLSVVVLFHIVRNISKKIVTQIFVRTVYKIINVTNVEEVFATSVA